jgi:hypothetical protein
MSVTARGVAIAALLAGALCAGRVAAAEVPACLVLPPVEEIAAADMPPPLRAALTRDVGVFALPGQGFDTTDVVRTGVRRRLLWLRKRATRWVAVFERGGRSYDNPFVVYEMGLDGRSIASVREGIAFPASVCQITERELWR